MSAVIILLQRQQDLVDRFRDAGATSAETSRPLDELGVPTGMMFSRLSRAGVFAQAGAGRWYFHAAAWRAYRDRQWKRLVDGAVVILAVGVLAVLLLMLR